ncbi:Oidioi.mRNA.OKI2018_I69.chr1.g686.t1.cds [Oikopleura dioica]|uniref:Oidioi.mRNA.OKI2018_I69.chr1.g686.t1.cds n=1 Tax=Oikopleura dioica TaxID=34765 RepID=A0ABN7SMC1_OIKDI|nr:Oidioi.mRNA.OKI2018_I69.chr1.g686.t1.cds [Oikopleura dioica]
MISDRIHKSWVTKIVKQTSFLQKKYNSADCRKYGNPNQSDVSDKWRNRAHRKFDTLELRVCKHLYKGLVKTKETDNPYKDNSGCDSSLFKEKVKDEKRRLKQEERLEAKGKGR